MAYKDVLDIIASWAAILTAAVASFGYGRFLLAQCARRKKLEDYLREEKLSSYDMGQRTVMHLMSNLSMTETEVLQAGFQSKKISSSPGQDERGRADRIFFEYSGNDISNSKKF
ncbi:hypothetical protein [Sphingopyxis sp. 550A]